jgi:hypothetical protein
MPAHFDAMRPLPCLPDRILGVRDDDRITARLVAFVQDDKIFHRKTSHWHHKTRAKQDDIRAKDELHAHPHVLGGL